MKKSRHIILYEEGTVENLVLAAAKHGVGNAGIHRLLEKRKLRPITDTQIATRLSKAKLWEMKERGYRVAYRNGESEEFQQLIEDRIAITQAEIARTLPQRITHPTPKVVEWVQEHLPKTSPKTLKKIVRKQLMHRELARRAKAVAKVT